MADIYVALLRGINVGGKNKLPMKGLAAMFADAGCREVQTYIQSGNVIFQATHDVARRIPSQIAHAIAECFGYPVPLVTRTAADIAQVAQSNPFLHDGADPDTLHVAFLADTPSAAKVDSLNKDRSPPDRFAVLGREIYLHCPNGFGRTRLTSDYFDRRLGTISTVRNWRTVLKLLELTGG